MTSQAIDLIFSIAVLIMSVVIHEVSHGVAANSLGDPTAKYEGRLTLNPLKHLDPFGSVLLPAILVFIKSPFIFGYAKPVPYNPYNLRNQKWGPAIVGAAGPASNILVAVIFAAVLRFFGELGGPAFGGIVLWLMQINIWLAIFNLIPIPPLDGSKLLFSLLPAKLYGLELALEQYGFFILIILIFLAPALLLAPLADLSEFIIRFLVGI